MLKQEVALCCQLADAKSELAAVSHGALVAILKL